MPATWLMPSAVPRCQDRKSTRLNSSHLVISYAVFCLKKKNPCQCNDRITARHGAAPAAEPFALGARRGAAFPAVGAVADGLCLRVELCRSDSAARPAA